MQLNDQTIQEAIQATIAKEILAGLNTSIRDALLQKSIAKTIGDYTFRDAVGKVVAAKAAEIATKLIASEEWEKRIEQAIRDGFDLYVANLTTVSHSVLLAAFHGDKDGYSHRGPARLLDTWPQTPKSE